MAEIAIDATGVPGELTGAGRYAAALAGALARLEQRPAIEVLTTPRARAHFEHVCSGWSTSVAAPSARPLRLLAQEYWVGALARRHGARVFHGLHYQLPQVRGMRFVVTVHDVTLLVHPEWHDRTKVLYFRHAIRNALRRADAIIVPSRFTRDRLVELTRTQIPVYVVYHGVEGVPQRDHRLGSPGPRTILALGTIEPRKNLVRVLKAFDVVAAEEPDLVLQIVGRRGWGLAEFDATLAGLRHRDRVAVLGFVEDAQLSALLARATALVYPSLEEGFGLPVLEALAAGLHVVTSLNSVMEEVAGGYATLVEPTSVSSIAEGLRRAVREARPPSTIEAQIAWATSFTWERAARSTLEIYRMLAGL